MCQRQIFQPSWKKGRCWILLWWKGAPCQIAPPWLVEETFGVGPAFPRPDHLFTDPSPTKIHQSRPITRLELGWADLGPSFWIQTLKMSNRSCSPQAAKFLSVVPNQLLGFAPVLPNHTLVFSAPHSLIERAHNIHAKFGRVPSTGWIPSWNSTRVCFRKEWTTALQATTLADGKEARCQAQGSASSTWALGPVNPAGSSIRGKLGPDGFWRECLALEFTLLALDCSIGLKGELAPRVTTTEMNLYKVIER